VGGKLLERVLNQEGWGRGRKVKCEAGHGAVFVDYRSKELTTVWGTINLRRAYYYCADTVLSAAKGCCHEMNNWTSWAPPLVGECGA
jgi:hypothetical protein